MKAPRRTPWQHTTEPCLNRQGELRATITDQHTRWKRKNRITRLKHTIAKQQRIIAKYADLFEQQKNLIDLQRERLSELEWQNICLNSSLNKLKDFINLIYKPNL